MKKLLLLTDFFPCEMILDNLDMMDLLKSAGDDLDIQVITDTYICGKPEPMGIIRGFERNGIEDVEPEPAVLEAVADADYLIVQWSPVNKKVIDAGKNLKYIGSIRSGFENIDKAYAESQGIHVENCPGRLGNAVADLTIAYILAFNKTLFERNLRTNPWPESNPYQSKIYRSMNMQTVGIVGFGAIGQKVASRLFAMECTVVAYDPFAPDEVFEKAGVKRMELDDLLKISDIVTLHVRSSEETLGIIGEHELSLMQPHALLVNSARADIIQEEPLVKALQEKRIAGACMDVFWTEPIPEDHPLKNMENVIITPHIGGQFPDMVPMSLMMLMKTFIEFRASEK